MRTALIILLIGAVASILGTLLPQAPQNPAGVQGFFQQWPTMAAVFQALGFFDVYGSWWFQVLLLLLFASLLSCLLPRTKAIIRRLLAPRPSATERFLANLKNSDRFETPLPAEEVLERAGRLLRAHRFSVTPPNGQPHQLCAEKGRYREIGGLFFHWSLLILLVGVVYGKSVGFDGSGNIIEGDTFIEGHLGYANITEGKFFGERHRGFAFKLNDFTATYHPSGMPEDFISDVTVTDNGKVVAQQKIRVNGKLVYKGIKFYQSSYGWAPRVRVARANKVLVDAPIIFFGKAEGASGVVKIPQADVGIETWFLPDLREDQSGVFGGSPYLKNPYLLMRVYKGDLRSSMPQNVYQLDTSQMQLVGQGSLKLNESTTLPGTDLTVSFPEIKEWSGFQIAYDPGIPIVYFAFTLAMIGLIITFYISHRRAWVMVFPNGRKSELLVGGIAETNKQAFELEFAKLVGLMREKVGGKVA